MRVCNNLLVVGNHQVSNVSSQCKEQCLPNHPISQNNAFIGLATLVLVRGPVIQQTLNPNLVHNAIINTANRSQVARIKCIFVQSYLANHSSRFHRLSIFISFYNLTKFSWKQFYTLNIKLFRCQIVSKLFNFHFTASVQQIWELHKLKFSVLIANIYS